MYSALSCSKSAKSKYKSSLAEVSDSDAAFRFIFSVDTLDAFEQATLKVVDSDIEYEPGYMQIYCEGAAQRIMGHKEPFDRLAVFFKNFALGKKGQDLPDVEESAKQKVLEYVNNPEDCIWTKLLTPRDLQQLFHFPGGNLDHTMMTGGQTYFDRNFSSARLNPYSSNCIFSFTSSIRSS